MPDLDQELLERVARWCAEAGRTTSPAEIRRALEPLGWDALLAVRALLADPPPAHPLGPFALAELGRGVPAQTAAERERAGAYPSPEAGDAGEAPPAPPPAAAPRRPGSKRGPRVQGPVIRRARDAAPAAPPPSPSVPLADALFVPEGRAVLERLVRRLGARRHAIVTALAEGWRTADGRPVDDELLDRLLDHHGLARAFARRERDELLHALRAAGGLRTTAASRLGLEREAFDAAVSRTGAAAEAERIREARRAEVRAKATLAERVRLLLTEPARLEDLGLLGEIEDDLRLRLPEHLRAVGAASGPVLVALGRSLSILPAEAHVLVERLGVPVELGRGPAPHGAPEVEPRARPRPGVGPVDKAGGMRPPRRPASGRPVPGPRPDRRSPGARGETGRAPRERRGDGQGGPRRDRPEGFGPPRERGGRREGSFGPPRERGGQREGGFGPPRERGAQREGGFGPPRERGAQREGGFGPPRERGGRREGGFGPPRERGGRREGGFGPPRERSGQREGGFGPPRERGGRREGGFGPPRKGGGRPAGGAGSAARRSGPGGGPGRPGPRPGGPRGKPPPRGPRRAR